MIRVAKRSSAVVQEIKLMKGGTSITHPLSTLARLRLGPSTSKLASSIPIPLPGAVAIPAYEVPGSC